jgi:hypothetical protein
MKTWVAMVDHHFSPYFLHEKNVGFWMFLAYIMLYPISGQHFAR